MVGAVRECVCCWGGLWVLMTGGLTTGEPVCHTMVPLYSSESSESDRLIWEDCWCGSGGVTSSPMDPFKGILMLPLKAPLEGSKQRLTSSTLDVLR